MGIREVLVDVEVRFVVAQAGRSSPKPVKNAQFSVTQPRRRHQGVSKLPLKTGFRVQLRRNAISTGCTHAVAIAWSVDQVQ
jgi:hypothetical protein